MEVFNRSGDRVFYTEDLNHGWDGMANGKPAPDGSYYYRVHYSTVFGNDGSTQGWVMLLDGH